MRLKYAFIKQRAGDYSIRRLCLTLKVHPSGYYAWLSEPQSVRAKDDQRLLGLVAKNFASHYGTLDTFDYPVTHAEAQALWDYFLDWGLAAFGDYQDAMASNEPFLFHARICLEEKSDIAPVIPSEIDAIVFQAEPEGGRENYQHHGSKERPPFPASTEAHERHIPDG